MRKLLLIALGALLVSAAITGVYVYRSSKDKTDTTQTQTTQTQNTQNTESEKTQTGTPKTYPVSVYFSKHTASDDDPSKTFAVARTSPNAGVAKFSITELLKGPTESEKTQGFFSYVRLRDDASSCGGADFTITIKDQVATLQFCKTFDHVGSVSDGQAESSIKATLLQFPTVKKVIILNKSGDCEFNLSGQNLCLQ